MKHRLLQSHRNSTNVLREQTLNLATARKQLRKSKTTSTQALRPSKNSPELLFCHHPWSLTYPGVFPHIVTVFQEQLHTGEQCLPPQPRCAHGSGTGPPSFLLVPSPVSPCDLYCLLTPCMLVQLELLL